MRVVEIVEKDEVTRDFAGDSEELWWSYGVPQALLAAGKLKA